MPRASVCAGPATGLGRPPGEGPAEVVCAVHLVSGGSEAPHGLRVVTVIELPHPAERILVEAQAAEDLDNVGLLARVAPNLHGLRQRAKGLDLGRLRRHGRGPAGVPRGDGRLETAGCG